MPIAAPLPEPTAFRTPQEVVEYMQAVIDRDSESSPPGFRPKVTALPTQGATVGADFLLTASGEGFSGGGGEVTVHLTPDEFDLPVKARVTFSLARLTLVRKMSEELHRRIAERERRDAGRVEGAIDA